LGRWELSHSFARKDYGMNKGIPFIQVADRVEVSVDVGGKRVSGPPLVFKEWPTFEKGGGSNATLRQR
jgi:hypothetical protein